ncbi:MAG: hypothetical protein WCF23_03070, partial [Candidatus Nitrosopolaris sp.]
MNTNFQRIQQSERNTLDAVILIANICMATIFTHSGRMCKTLQKRYIGKTIGDLVVRKVAKKADTTPTKMRKLKVIKEKAQGGNLLAQEYLEKLKNGKVST